MNQLIASERQRIRSIDILRGIVMIIMALDHVRDFFHSQAMIANPLDLKTTTSLLFFTRWITHFCAPVFVFLSGTSAYLSGRRKSKKALSLFLIKRGAWLVCVELIVITFALTFDPFYSLIVLQVIWAIGVSMIILGVLIWLPFPVLVFIGLLICFGHNLLDYPSFSPKEKTSLWWLLIHSPFSPYTLSKTHFVLVAYAFMPWTGVMICGYCFGHLFEGDAKQRVRSCTYTGTVLIGLFIILRSINAYGDPVPWAVQRDGLFTFLSFINVTKYPPSLLYICLTLGPALLFLGIIEKVQNRFTDVVSLYGRVPFFYYVIHFYLIHTLCLIAFFLWGYTSADIANPASPFLFRPPSFGFPLMVVYLIWLFVVIIVYPACRRYDRYKSTHKQWWLSYL